MYELCRFAFQNLQNVKIGLTGLRSQTVIIPYMSFAGLQVCFLSLRPKTHDFPTQWNNYVVMWITCGKVHMSRRRYAIMNKEIPQPVLLTIAQVSMSLGLSRTKIYALIATEGLPVIRFGRALRVSPTSLQQWLQQRERDLSA
jgi:excisionase family DNA binding protein